MSLSDGRKVPATPKIALAVFVLALLFGASAAVLAASPAPAHLATHLPVTKGAVASSGRSTVLTGALGPLATRDLITHTSGATGKFLPTAGPLPRLGATPAVSTIAPPSFSPFSFNVSTGLGPEFAFFDPTNGLIYVSDAVGNTESVISPVTGLTVATINVGVEPGGIAYDPVHNQIFVANTLSNNVSVIDPVAQKSVGAIGLGASTSPLFITYDPLNKLVYVSNLGTSNVSILNPATDKTVGEVGVGSSPAGVILDSATGYLYVPNFGGSNVTVISGMYNTVKANVTAGCNSEGGSFDPATGQVYIPDICTPSVVSIGGWPPAVTGTAALPGGTPRSALFDPADQEIYVADSSANYVSVVDPSSMTVVASLPGLVDTWVPTYDSANGAVYIPESGLNTLFGIGDLRYGISSSFTDLALDNVASAIIQPSYDPTSNLLYVPDFSTNVVGVISLATNSIVRYDSAGVEPYNSFFDPQNDLLYVDNVGGTNVSVYSEGNPTPIASITVGSFPWGMSFNAGASLLYVANEASGTISVISTRSNVVVATITTTPKCTNPVVPTYDPGNNRIYVSCAGSSYFQVESAINNTAEGLLLLNADIANYPFDAVLDPVTGDLFVDSRLAPAIEVFSTANNKSLGNITGFASAGLFYGAYDPATGDVLFFGYGGTFAFSESTFANTWFTPTFSGSTSDEVSGTYDPLTGQWLALLYDATNTLQYLVSQDPGPVVTSLTASTSVAGGDLGSPLRLAVGTVATPVPTSQTSFWGVPGCIVLALGSQSRVCTPSTVGSFTLTATVQDADNMVNTVLTPFSVHAAPTVTVGLLTPSSSVDVGQTLRFLATPAGGWAGGSYAWTSSSRALGCASSTNAWLNCTTVANGSALTVSVAWTDGAGVSSAVASSGAITVVGGPTVVGAPLASSWNPVGDDVGQTVTFSATVAGGTGPFTYAWSGLPGCASMSVAALSCSLATPGSFSIGVAVTDADGVVANSPSLNYVVSAAPSITSVQVHPGSASVEVGQSVSFTAQTSGGSAGGAFLWKGMPASLDCVNATGPTITCWPTAVAATDSVEVAWTDANGVQSAWVTGAVSVSSALQVSPLLGTASALDVGQTVTFNATVIGGLSPYTYHWAGLPGCAATTTFKDTCVASQSGNFAITLTVVDNLGVSWTSLPVAVDVSPALGTPVVTASSSSGQVGSPIVFTASVSGGAAPYNYAWSGLPSGCASANQPVLVCTPSSSGSISAKVTVSDANGASATSAASAAVSIAAAPSLESAANGMLALELAIAGLALAVVALLVALLRKGGGGSKPAPAPSTSAPAPTSTTSAPPEPAAASPSPPPPPPPPPPLPPV